MDKVLLQTCGIAPLIGAITNVATHWEQFKTANGWQGFWKFTAYALAAAAYEGIAAAVGFTGVATGVASGAAIGAASGIGGFIEILMVNF